MISLLVLFLPLSTPLPLLGWVESPGYPRGYPNENNFEWTRCAPPGHTLHLTLTHLDLEESEGCMYDSVEISSDEGKLVSLCGRKSYEELQSSINPLLQSSVSGCLMLSFRSDYSNVQRHAGFRAFYTAKDFDECEDPNNACSLFCGNYIGGYRCYCWPGYYLEEDNHTCSLNCSADVSGSVQGAVSSPGRPGPYPQYALCSHTLAVEDDLQLVLEFMGEFDVQEDQGGQCIDSVTINTPTNQFGPFCGSVPPPSPLLTGSHRVEILFSSEGTGTNGGFSLSYKTAAKICPGEVTSNSRVNPEKPQYRQGEEVTVTCEAGRYPLSEYRSVCQRTGVWSPVIPCQILDCGPPDVPKDGPLQLSGPTNGTLYQAQVRFQCESKHYVLEPSEPYICDAQGEWRSKSGQTTLPKCVTVCGQPDFKPRYARIYGGKEAEPGEIPWQLWLYSLNGGAVLIGDRWAVTAAHVAEKHKGTRLRVYGGLVRRRGAYRIEVQGLSPNEVVKDFPHLAVLESEKIIFHPAYTKGVSTAERLNYDNDIALIKLESRAKLGPSLLPVCLPEKKGESIEGKKGTVSGWGRTEKNNHTASRALLHADITGYSQKKCSEVSEQNAMIYTDNMFCGGGEGKDSCQGDSGGPFVVPTIGERKGPYRLYGIVSWGPACKDTGYYTKVDNYVDWIKETIAKEEKEESEIE